MIDTARPYVFLPIGQWGLGGAEYRVTLLANGLPAHGVNVSVGVLFERGPHARTLGRYRGHRHLLDAAALLRNAGRSCADATVDTYLAACRRLAGWEKTHAVAH